MTDANDPLLPQTVLCVPGPWATRSDLVGAVIHANNGHLFAGQILLNTHTNFACELQFQSSDPRMQASFRAVGPHWADTPEMARIGEHASVAYLVANLVATDSAAPDSPQKKARQNAEALMRSAAALLDAGGLGVKVESSGLAHNPAVWRTMCAEQHLFSAHRAYVPYISGPQVYSCGMHNLGLRDAIVENFGTAASVALVRAFTWYLFTQAPSVRHGQTFAVSIDAPTYRIFEDEGPGHDSGSLFVNPYGYWRLTPA